MGLNPNLYLAAIQLINVRPVGRPPQKDKDGEIITRSTVNVTIPSKLAEFLKEEGVNRSKLFTKAATELYQDRICPVCFTKDVKNTLIGIRCDGACSRYADRAGAFFFKFHRCMKCEQEFQPGSRLPVDCSDEIQIRIICEACNVNSK